jgi:hypothetical protein
MQTETNQKQPADYDRLQMQISEMLVSKEPIVATFTEVLLNLAEVAPQTLHERQYPYLFQMLQLFNTMQLVQLEMERMVHNA